MKEEIRKLFDTANGSRKQNAYGLQTKPRFRSKSLSVQLQEALLYAQSLEKVEADDDASISKMKLATVRIQTLKELLRKKTDGKAARLTKALAENERLAGEIEKLKSELQQAAAKPRTLSVAEQALAQYEARKQNGGL